MDLCVPDQKSREVAPIDRPKKTHHPTRNRSIGTILMNQTIIRGNGQLATLRSSYLFYDEEGHGRFQFIVAMGEKPVPIIGAVVEAPESASVVRSTLKYEDP